MQPCIWRHVLTRSLTLDLHPTLSSLLRQVTPLWLHRRIRRTGVCFSQSIAWTTPRLGSHNLPQNSPWGRAQTRLADPGFSAPADDTPAAVRPGQMVRGGTSLPGTSCSPLDLQRNSPCSPP
jgi:hypothetical protein